MCQAFNCALLMLTCTCLVMVGMDTYLMQVIMVKKNMFEQHIPDYGACLRPKFQLRIAFAAYSTLLSFTALLLSIALMACDEYSQNFERFVSWIINGVLFCFGPVLLTFCL